LGLSTAAEKGVNGLNVAATLVSGLMKHNTELMTDHFVQVTSGVLGNFHLDPVHLMKVPLVFTGKFADP